MCELNKILKQSKFENFMAYLIGEIGDSCKLRLNGTPVPPLQNGYSVFNGTKYRCGFMS